MGRRRSSAAGWVIAALLIPGVAIALLLGTSNERGNGPVVFVTATDLFRVFVTATPPSENPNATPVLPAFYIAELSATPPQPGEASPIPNVTPPPLVTATPVLFVSATPPPQLRQDQIVYVCFLDGSDEICLMNADGTNIRRLTDRSGTDWYPSFTPDGDEIVYSSQGGVGNFDIYIMDLNGENNRQLTQNLGLNFAPDMSPDGTQIVFTSTFGEGVDQNIWVINADGSDPRQLTFDPADDIDPAWSPDGSQISFASNRNGTTELFVMDRFGGSVRQVSQDVNIGGRNDWSIFGLMSFYAGPPGAKEVFTLNLDGSSLRQLTNGGNNKGPSFSPDGEWISYASLIDGDNEVFIMRIDGTQQRQLTFNNFADWQPRWQP
ncbi:MAG: hypothetical protein GYB68_14405 [Chloroflexi bacterium]|nr:hypothetical protein [Chloroflexota bacterium]